MATPCTATAATATRSKTATALRRPRSLRARGRKASRNLVLLLSLKDLNGTLCYFDSTRCDCFTQSLWIGKVDIGETLTLVDLDFLDRSEPLQCLFNQRFRDALRSIGVL
jgi:hypothetical protein